PPEVSTDLLAYVGCVSGAILIEEYKRGLERAGFAHAEIIDTEKDLNVYAEMEGQEGCATEVNSLPVAASGCCGPSTSSFDHLTDLLSRYNINDYAASVRVFAVKPPRTS
ncbi:MAG TPA: SAM-dependent methyltransferase, partial [Blastocatellia bacterium]|nr:SAM-dependent methyltransferase [Blastocatellia bacterium]